MQQTTTPLTQYLQPLLSYKKLVAAVAIVIMLAGTIVGFLAPTNYRSSASIEISPVEELDVINSDKVDVATELRIATSRNVVDQVAERLQSEGMTVDPDVLADNVSVSSPKDTRILDISYVSPSPEDSATIANTFAEIYVQYSSARDNEKIGKRQRDLETKIDILNSQLIEITAERAGVEDGSRQATDLNIQQRTVEGELFALQTSLTRLSTIGASGSEVVDAAQAPSSPEGLGSIQIVFGSLLAGLALGAMAAFAMDAFVQRDKATLEASTSDRRDRRSSDRRPLPAISQSSGSPVPAIAAGEIVTSGVASEATGSETTDAVITNHSVDVPRHNPSSALPDYEPAGHEPASSEPTSSEPTSSESTSSELTDEHLIASMDPIAEPELASSFSAAADYDELLDELAGMGTDGPVVILCVTGDGHPETAVAAGLSLAAELHNMGANVLVVDTVLHDPVVGSIVGLPESPGLADVLSGASMLHEAVRPIPVFEEIRVLTVGPASQETYSALNDGSFAEILSVARDQFHVTVIVGGTINDARISSSVGSLADGLVLAAPVAVGQSLPADLHDRVRELPARTLAVISAGQIGTLLDRSLDNEAQQASSSQ